ncbi:MAG: S53 family peptidase [Chloroflexota bacterium]
MLVASLGSATSAATGRAALAGSVPSWATTGNLKHASATGATVGFRVYLGWRDQAGAEALARAVSDPHSAKYDKYLTPAQFRKEFAPTQAQITAVQNWLRGQGFTVDYTPTNNHYVAAEGTLAQAATAFATTFNDYSVDGKTVRAPARALSVPATLAASVTAVLGLDQSYRFVHTNRVSADSNPPSAFVNAPPCSTYWAEKTTATTLTPTGTTLPTDGNGPIPYAPCGYTPPQLQGAYGVASAIASGNDGHGQTVAVIDAYASPTIVNDVNTYSTRHGVPAFTGGQFSQVVAPGTFKRPQNPRQDPEGWSGEQTLDIEAVHSMAPGAKIVYVGAPNNYQDLDAALNHVVDRGLAQIVTNSYGFSTEFLPKGYVKPYNDTFIQAAIEGIGVYFSSGDSGDEIDNVGYRTVDWPASSPWVTAVGGTSLAVGASNDYLFETGWGTIRTNLNSAATAWDHSTDTFLYAAGGGASCLFAQPGYQAGVVPSAISTHSGRLCGSFKGRAVPDVSAIGDPNTGMLVGQTQTFPDGTTRYSEYRIGGTSLSSPIIAGIMALADQRAGHHHGFANPALYAAGTSAYHDIVNPASPVAVVRSDFVNGVDATNGYRYTLRKMNQTGTIHTVAGYDDVTGLGTPTGSFIEIP